MGIEANSLLSTPTGLVEASMQVRKAVNWSMAVSTVVSHLKVRASR